MSSPVRFSCNLLVLIFSTMLLSQSAEGSCKRTKIDPSLRPDAKLVLARSNPYFLNWEVEEIFITECQFTV